MGISFLQFFYPNRSFPTNYYEAFYHIKSQWVFGKWNNNNQRNFFPSIIEMGNYQEIFYIFFFKKNNNVK